MLYLALFSALAVGFYSAFTLASQTTYNERDTRRALAAAESGMEFMRHQLWALNITYSSSPADLFNRVETGLKSALNGTANLKGGNIGRSGNVILIPADANQYIDLDGTGVGFRAEVTYDGTQLVVSTVGRFGSTTESPAHGVRLRYAVIQRPSSIFNFGVASKSPISLTSNAKIIGSSNAAHGSVLSTSYKTSTPVTLLGNTAISGDVSLVNPNASVKRDAGASIAGSTNQSVINQHIHKGVATPEFPIVDTEEFKKYATNVISQSGKTFDTTNLKNLYIKANTNPKFSGSIKVEGVVYIETPNYVQFDSNVQMTGVIAVQNNPTGSSNLLEFKSNVKLKGVEHLPATADFPAELRAMKGAMILAPGFKLNLDSNFGAQGGSIIADEMIFNSNATGTINGSVINLKDTSVTFDSNATIKIANQGASYAPAGLYFGSRYEPMPNSYEEFLP